MRQLTSCVSTGSSQDLSGSCPVLICLVSCGWISHEHIQRLYREYPELPYTFITLYHALSSDVQHMLTLNMALVPFILSDRQLFYTVDR